MQFNTVKRLFIVCVTIILLFVLFISYSEYVNRYNVVVAPNSDLYIFDKRQLTLNICNRSGCIAMNTRLMHNVVSANAKKDVIHRSQTLSRSDGENGTPIRLGKDVHSGVNTSNRRDMQKRQRKILRGASNEDTHGFDIVDTDANFEDE